MDQERDYMPPVNPLTPTSSNNISRIYLGSSNVEDPDIWFDTIDQVEMEETWFDACEDHQAEPSSSAGETADLRVPFTEDCRRGVQQLVRTLGEYGENKMLSACLSKILPGTPASLIIAANSLYTAVTEGRNIDTAALHALGLASWYLPENINVVSGLASFIRDTVSGWTDETFLQPLIGNEENQTSIHLFTALAITAIVAGRWMKDAGAPQRGVLKVPAFMANIFIRASHYRAELGNMAGSLPSGAAIPENTGPSQRAPAFEVDTQAEWTRDVCDAAVSCTSSIPRLTAFSSNSTASPGAYTRATVQNRPAPATGGNTHLSLPEQAHYLAVDKLRQKSGLSDLLYCTDIKTESRQRINEKVVTNAHFNTKCDAIAYPEPLTKETDSLPVHADMPETQVTSAETSRSGGDALLPLVTGAAVASVTTPYIQGLKSKTVIAAGAAMGLTGLTVGGILWNRFRTLEPEAPGGNLAGDKSRDVSSSDNVALQNEALIKSAVPQLGSGDSLEDSFGIHSLPHHDVMENRIRHRVRHVLIDSPKEQTQLPAPEDVKIEKLDYSCIEERQDLSLTQILRQIGKTLQNPITELAKESQVINYYNNLGRCPTKGDVEKIEHITMFVDKVVSAVITLLPYSQPIAILQSVGGPLFKLMADDIEQKENDKIEAMQEIAEQVIFLSKSITEKIPRDNKNKVSDAKISLPKGIFFHEGRIYTQINGDRWELSYKKERFFATRENVEKEVEYSTKEEEWIIRRNIEEINTEDVSLDENLVFSKEETEKVISELAVDAEHFERINHVKDTELYRVTLSNNRIYNCIKINGKFLPFRAISLNNSDFEVYNIKKPRKTGYSIFISADNKFHLGKHFSLSMRRGIEFIPYASDKLKKAIPSSYYIKNLDMANLTPITSRGIVKSADNKKYILLEKGYVQIERHPILPKVYQLGPSDRDKILCYYDKEANKFFSIPEERSFSGQMAGRRSRGGNDHPYSQENILKYQFGKQQKLNNYRDGFRTNNFNDYKIIKEIDIRVTNRVNNIYLYGLNDEEASHSIKYKKVALKIRRDIGSANMMIERVKESLLNIEHPNHVTNSFHRIFDIEPNTTESGKLIELFVNRLDATKKILESYISDDFINIWLINHNDNGIIAETWKGDPLRRMYINIKKTNAYKKQNSIRRFFMKSSSKDDVPTVIHEASHQGADTVDSFYLDNASLENKISRLKSGEMTPLEIKAILDSDEAIALPPSLKTEKEIATDLFNRTPYVRAKLLLNNADSFSALVTELFSDMQKMHKREIISQHFENPEIIYLLFALALE